MSALVQKIKAQERTPLFDFTEQPCFVILCEKCGQPLKQFDNNGDMSLGNKTVPVCVFLRYKTPASSMNYNKVVTMKRLLDLFSSYCSKCEFEHFHSLNGEDILETKAANFN